MWRSDLNDGLTAYDVGSTIKYLAWWECTDCHYLWQISVGSMTAGSGCPRCAGHIPTPGVNDFATLHPERAAKWHPTKNNGRKPEEFTENSSFNAHWACAVCTLEWESTIADVVQRKHACQGCFGRVVAPGVNDMGTTHPDKAAQWHPTKNGDQLPEHYRPGSNVKVFWLCEVCGDGWEAVIASRCLYDSGCPTCAGFQVKVGFNDLKTCAPEYAATWHPTKNGDALPEHYTISSRHRAWWLCDVCGYEWEQTIDVRTAGGCASCAGQRVHVGFNDFGSKRPDLAIEWHPTMNGDRLPEHYTVASGQFVWWQCKDCNHSWRAAISMRTCHGRGCPACSGNIVVLGVNDLESQQPQLMPDWHPTKNDRPPSSYHEYSSKRAYWICKKCQHEWDAVISSRSYGCGCPSCANEVASHIEGRLRTLLTRCQSFDSDLGGTDVTLPVRSQRRGFVRVDAVVNVASTGESLVIEYDGARWHQPSENIEFDTRKTLRLIANGYKVVRIREHDLDLLPMQNSDLLQIPYKWHHEDATLQEVVDQIEAWVS